MRARAGTNSQFLDLTEYELFRIIPVVGDMMEPDRGVRMKACRCRWGHSSGFTLVEIMIVVAIIGMLAMIAVPSFIAARKRALVTATVSDLRVFEEAFHQYNLENGAYPLPSYQPPFMIFQPGELPPPMEGYLKERHWNATTPCGGQYYWHCDRRCESA
jgi:prepilin-type N-terminal cleavage/methylation domain-containing protein